MNRVYVRDGDIWTLASVYALRAPLPMGTDEYVVFETARPPSVEEVCGLAADRWLCDFGPGHEHHDGD